MATVIAIQLLLLVYHQVTTWFDLYPFNGARNYSPKEKRAEATVNAVLMSLGPVGFGLRIRWLMISDEWHPLEEGAWHVEGTRVIMHTKKADSESAKYEGATWSITAVGHDGFLAQGSDADQFKRLSESELNARPAGVSCAIPPSPPPKERQSPRR